MVSLYSGALWLSSSCRVCGDWGEQVSTLRIFPHGQSLIAEVTLVTPIRIGKDVIHHDEEKATHLVIPVLVEFQMRDHLEVVWAKVHRLPSAGQQLTQPVVASPVAEPVAKSRTVISSVFPIKILVLAAAVREEAGRPRSLSVRSGRPYLLW